jgi:hypothetical protein
MTEKESRSPEELVRRANYSNTVESVSNQKIGESPPVVVLGNDAYHGLAGEIVQLLEPHSEADPAGLLVQLVVAFGNVVGRGPHCMVESSRHGTNLFVVLVGNTANGRKGTGWNRVTAIFEFVDPSWKQRRVLTGLSSGEGLIWNVRDPVESSKPDEESGRREIIDQGESDKRLMIIEEEFASVLKVMTREGNTLSPVVRTAWDSGRLATMTRHSPAQATDAHISIVGHVTQAELLKHFAEVDAANGFGNRFMWIEVKRSKLLPHGGRLSEKDFATYGQEIAKRVQSARQNKHFERSDEANQLWEVYYPKLTEPRHNLFGAITARAAPIVLRLSLIYALLDSSPRIEAVHLKAARAVWDYAEESARRVFGDGLGDPMADEIMQMLRGSPNGMTRTEIRDAFGRNQRPGALARVLGMISKAELIDHRYEPGTGRPVERWFLKVRPNDLSPPSVVLS